MLEFAHSSKRPFPVTSSHLPATSFHYRHSNHAQILAPHKRQTHHQLQRNYHQIEGLKHRAKSVPNLDVTENPQFVRNDHTGTTYAIGRLLGQGGFAKCFLAYSNNQYFALKVIPRNNLKRTTEDRIHREILTHYYLHHPNIVALYNTFECSRNFYLLLEYCPNRTLAEHIEQSPGKCLPECNSIVFMKQLLLAVHYLHEDCSLVHRDIKPGNVLLSREWAVKLADFGFCCSIEELQSRQVHSVCGTPNYISPEVVDKLGHNEYTDCWSLACTFFVMLFGKPPFHSDNHLLTYARIRSCEYSFPIVGHYAVSEASKNLIRRTLIICPNQRLNTAQMLVHPAINPIPSFSQNNLRSPLHEGWPSTIPGNSCSTSTMKACSRTARNSSFLASTTDQQRKWTEAPTEMCCSTAVTGAVGDSGLDLLTSAELSPTNFANATTDMGRVFQDGIQKYIEIIQSLLDPLNPLNFSLSDTLSTPPDSFVTKWVNYTNRIGFGVHLQDGTCSILFNDQSSISASQCQRFFSYCPSKFNEKCLRWSYRDGFPNNVYKKVSILENIRQFMDHKLHSPVPTVMSNSQIQQQEGIQFGSNADLLHHHQQPQSPFMMGHGQQSAQTPQLVHILDYRKYPDALFILLSNGICQVNFTKTHHKLAMYALSAPNEPNGISYELHLITGDRRNFRLKIRTEISLTDAHQKRSIAGHDNNSDWSILVKQFQRVLQNYRHDLLDRSSQFLPSFATYC